MSSSGDSRQSGQTPADAPPPGCREIRRLSVHQRGMLLWLNLLSLIPLAAGGLIVLGGLALYHGPAGAPLVLRGLPAAPPTSLGYAGVLAVLPLHEWIHGIFIRRAGHRPRYGVKWMVLFATADGALFGRGEYLRIALAPLALISLGGALLLPWLPIGWASWVGLAVVVNGAGAIGDLWMAAVVARQPPNVLIRDEEDGLRIFAPTP